jgi:hypothetical protein
MNIWDMSNEDLDRWEVFLRLTVDRAFDYGFDSVSVLDKIASTIASHSSLSLLSSTRISDLLLANLDIADTRTVPVSLCELINDTLTSIYPPTEQNKLPSVWLLRTLTRILGACPIELIEQLLECVQDGLCRWISDESQALTEQEYNADIVSAYQTATVVLMSIPTKSAAVVEKFAGILYSAFCGRSDKPESMAQSFLELWESTYGSVAPPKHGWSEQIIGCLRVVGLVSTSKQDEMELSDAEEVEDQLLSQVSPSDDVPMSPVIPSPGTLAASFVLRSPSQPPCELQYPTTPTVTKKRIVTPPRPNKTPSSPVQPLGPLFVQESPSKFPIRSPVTPKKRTPGSGICRADKENTSPLRLIASVAEHISHRSPLAHAGSILGKRLFDDVDDEPIVQHFKRTRKEPHTVFAHRSPRANPQPSSVIYSQPSSSKVTLEFIPRKRRGMVVDAVEVPTLREVMRRNISLDASEVLLTSNRLLGSKDKELRRCQSVPKLGSSGGHMSPVKRRRPDSFPEHVVGQPYGFESEDDDRWSSSSPPSSSLRGLLEMQAMGSGKPSFSSLWVDCSNYSSFR